MHDANSTGAVNYLNLAREILQNNEMTLLKGSDRQIDILNEN
jgi:chromosome partitioning protein